MAISDTSSQDEEIGVRSRRKVGIVAALALALFVIGALLFPFIKSYSQSDTTVSAERLRLATVQYKDLSRELSIQGRVVAAVSPRVYSASPGTITLHIKAGDSVNKDQLLASVDSPELSALLMQEQLSLEEAQSELSRQRIQAKKRMLEDKKAVDIARVALVAAEREKRRADKGYNTSVISQIDYEKAQDDLNNAKLVFSHAEDDARLNQEALLFEIQRSEHQVNRQKLTVAELQRQVDALALRSPVTGIVGNVMVEDKNQVAINQAILSVVDLSELELSVSIPESYADDLAIGMQAEVVFNQQQYPAQLASISPEIENNQVTGRVRFDASRMPDGLRQNQRLTTRILLETKQNILTVSQGQFLQTAGGSVAYKVEGNLAQRVRIQTGSRSLSDVEIVSGLQPNDTIIISSTEAFGDAETVLITQ